MTQLFLINISGSESKPYLSAVTSLLASQKVRILDIGQSLIHEQVSLALLVSLPESLLAEADFSEKLQHLVTELGLSHSLQSISSEQYQHWVEQQGSPRHIVTLLAREISAEHLAKVAELAETNGLQVDKISRLSGRKDLQESPQENPLIKACVEIAVRGFTDNLPKLREDFMALSAELDVDVSVQEDDLYRRSRRLVCFDMDSTLIEAEVIDELAIRAGVGEQVAAITEAAMRGEIDFTESFAQRMALLEGLDESVLADIAENLPVTEGAARLMKNLRQLGMKTAILSGGFNYFGRYLQKKLGMDYVFANNLEIENGKVTGRVVGDVVDGKRKALLLQQIAAEEGIPLQQVVAVGDGANDLPMLGLAGLGIAFRAKPLVRESAEHSISQLGLDAILYLMGLRDREELEED